MSTTLPHWSLWVASTKQYKAPSVTRNELDTLVAAWSRLVPKNIFVGADWDEWARLELQHSPYYPAVYMHKFCNSPYDNVGHKSVADWTTKTLSTRRKKRILLNFEGLWKPWGQNKPITGHSQMPSDFPRINTESLWLATKELNIPDLETYYLWCALGSEDTNRCTWTFWLRHSLSQLDTSPATVKDILLHPKISGATYDTPNRRALAVHAESSFDRIISPQVCYILYPGGTRAGKEGWEHSWSTEKLAELFWSKELKNKQVVVYIPYDVLPESASIVSAIEKQQ